MKMTKNFIATIVLAYLLSMVLPWWSIMLASFITAILFRLKKSAVFFIPFLAITLLWIVNAYWLSSTNDFILSQKISELLKLGENAYVLILISGLVGGIAAGIAAIFGNQCAALMNGSKSK